MNCPRCERQTLKVLESRSAESGDAIRRRRECLACGHRFTTYERLEEQPLLVTKHDGTREAFDRQKLLFGLMRACSKREVPAERLEGLVIDIETQLRRLEGRTISSDEIGERAMAGLLTIDEVAYVRFASVYRAFDSLEEFRSELRRLGTHAARTGLSHDETRQTATL